jgi:hypothetical protein
VALFSEFWSLNINRVHPHVPPLITTPPPSPYNRVQNNVLRRWRVLYLRAVKRVLKPNWDSRRLDWTRLAWCEHPLTLESDWTGLDSTRLDSVGVYALTATEKKTVVQINIHTNIYIEIKSCKYPVEYRQVKHGLYTLQNKIKKKLPPLCPDTEFPRRSNLKNPCREYHFVDRSVASFRTTRPLKLPCHTRNTASDCPVTLMGVQRPEFTKIFRTNKKLKDLALHFTYTSLLLTHTNSKFKPKPLKNNWNLVCKFVSM